MAQMNDQHIKGKLLLLAFSVWMDSAPQDAMVRLKAKEFFWKLAMNDDDSLVNV